MNIWDNAICNTFEKDMVSLGLPVVTYTCRYGATFPAIFAKFNDFPLIAESTVVPLQYDILEKKQIDDDKIVIYPWQSGNQIGEKDV